MSRKKDGTDSAYKPHSGSKKTREEQYHLRSGHQVVEIDGSDSALGSDRASTGEPEIGSRTVSREEGSLEAVSGGPSDVGEFEENIHRTGEVREARPKMSRQESAGFNMETFMKMMADMEEKRDRRREEERRKEREDREEQRRRDREKEETEREEREQERKRDREREDRVIQQLQEQLGAANATTRPIPEQTRMPIPTLPKLGPDTPLETFLTTFEAQLRGSGVPEDQWKYHLIGQIDDKHRTLLTDCMADDTFTYANLVERLDKLGGETSVSAAERYFAPEADGSRIKNATEAIDVTRKWLAKMLEGIDNKKEIVNTLARARVRSWFTAPLKEYVDQKEPASNSELVARVNQWLASRGDDKPVFTRRESKRVTPYPVGGGQRKAASCFLCGKVGHLARQCRARKDDGTKTPEKPERPEKTPVPGKKVTCYVCGETGHKSPACPKRKDKTTKRVKTRQTTPEVLKENDLLVRVGGSSFPATLDTGATVSVIPKEFVREDALTGETEQIRGFREDVPFQEAPLAEVSIQAGGLTLKRKVALLDGKSLGWEGAISFSCKDREQRKQLTKLLDYRSNMTEEQAQYLPPRKVRGKMTGAVAWEPIETVVQEDVIDSEVFPSLERQQVISESEQTVTPKPADLIPEVTVEETGGKQEHPRNNEQGETIEIEQVEEEALGFEDVLEVGEGSSDDVEVEGVMEDGADQVRNPTLTTCGEAVKDRQQLADDTLADNSLTTARRLADAEAEGYEWNDGLLYKCYIDPGGTEVKRLCLPVTVRPRCITLTHDQFGHRGYKRVAQDLSKVFYWPSLWRDVRRHCKECGVCQRHSKAKPRRVPMHEREVLTVPSERVCVDLVGPLPRAKGGMEFILTCIDVATRWPEAVALKTTTAQVVIRHLTEMFSRNGFPGVLVSDNGPQFVSKAFANFCEKNGINHVRTAIYSPESNGIVERFHGSLKRMLAKCKEGGGNWPDLLPMTLFFLRMTPCESSGFSPFLLSHGWEPNTPAKLLYNAWVSQEAGKLCVEQWVRENTEKVQAMRDEASANYRKASATRKEKWDRNSSPRDLKVGQLVWYRTPGLNEALQPSWEGPYKITQVAGPLSYKLDVKGKQKCVHIKFLKEWQGKSVKRVTTTLEDDTESDDLVVTNPKVAIEPGGDETVYKEKLGGVLEKFTDILCEEPGLTGLVELEIDTGEAPPIYQCAYNTPVSVRGQVTKEIEWLREWGYIRESHSPWASPIVTVRKPNGDICLCVDYK